jgi:hypothetical protein
MIATVFGLSHHSSIGTQPKKANASTSRFRMDSVRSVGRAMAKAWRAVNFSSEATEAIA